MHSNLASVVYDGRRDIRVEARIQRFPIAHRKSVEALARQHANLADLALSFPALLFAMAVPKKGFDPSAAITAATAGASLKELARLAALPMWSRKLIPEAFDRPIDCLPQGEFLAPQISYHVTRSPKLAARWLHAVSYLTKWSTPVAPVWIAREIARSPKTVRESQLNLIALYIWFSAAPDTAAGRLIDKPWTASMPFTAAIRNAKDWIENVAFRARAGAQPVLNCWLKPAEIDGFDFVPLRSDREVSDEAIHMKNCLRTYGWRIQHGKSRIWSVRCQGKRVATLELAWRGQPLLQIVQIRGPSNASVSLEIWWAARKWLNAHDLLAIRPENISGPKPIPRDIWIELWRPYWIAKAALPVWLPLCPSHRTLRDL